MSAPPMLTPSMMTGNSQPNSNLIAPSLSANQPNQFEMPPSNFQPPQQPLQPPPSMQNPLSKSKLTVLFFIDHCRSLSSTNAFTAQPRCARWLFASDVRAADESWLIKLGISEHRSSRVKHQWNVDGCSKLHGAAELNGATKFYGTWSDESGIPLKPFTFHVCRAIPHCSSTPPR